MKPKIDKGEVPRIKAVFFDIGNVLLSFDAAEVVKKMAWKLKLNPFKLARFAWHSGFGEKIERGELSPRELYRLFCRDVGYTGDYAAFRNLWSDHFTLNKGTSVILDEVARKRKVFLLSNTNHLHYEFIRRHYAFAASAHGAVLSYRLKMRKPEPGIYLAALRKARVRAEEAFFIDDLAENVEGARKVGMVAMRFTTAAALRQELRGLGIL